MCVHQQVQHHEQQLSSYFPSCWPYACSSAPSYNCSLCSHSTPSPFSSSPLSSHLPSCLFLSLQPTSQPPTSAPPSSQPVSRGYCRAGQGRAEAILTVLASSPCSSSSTCSIVISSSCQERMCLRDRAPPASTHLLHLLPSFSPRKAGHSHTLSLPFPSLFLPSSSPLSCLFCSPPVLPLPATTPPLW